MRFPLNPPRGLSLTSPLTKGQDVLFLQQACNVWAKAHNLSSTAEDGVFGSDTHYEVGIVAWSMGLRDTSAVYRGVIRLIWHPWMRTPPDYKRAADRAKQGPKGLSALPSIAAKYIGVAESPAGSNTGLPNPSGWERNFGIDRQPWCGCFAGSMVLLAGGHVTSRVVYCPYIEQDARAGVNGFVEWQSNHQQAGSGWLVLYCWDGSGTPDHVGIVESFQSDHLVAIEGNTSGTNPADGGMVARMNRSYGNVVGYARPRL